VIVPYALLVCTSVALSVAFLMRYPGRPTRQSAEPGSEALVGVSAFLAAIATWIHPSDRARPITFLAPVGLFLVIATCIVVMQLRDRRARRAAAAGGETSPTAPEPTDGDGPK